MLVVKVQGYPFPYRLPAPQVENIQSFESVLVLKEELAHKCGITGPLVIGTMDNENNCWGIKCMGDIINNTIQVGFIKTGNHSFLKWLLH
jgi:hypothetical protein